MSQETLISPPKRQPAAGAAISWPSLCMIAAWVALLCALSGCVGSQDRLAAPHNLSTPEGAMTFYEFTPNSLQGDPIPFSQYKGKYVLVVNTASECGYTPQYANLQAFHEKYGDKVAVLGFPANNFMGQEPGSNEEIASFCKRNYGVTFQMFEKISVKGDDQHPLYRWLTNKAENGWNEKAPSWNFSKYLISPEGKLLRYFGPGVLPDDPEILSLLGQS